MTNKLPFFPTIGKNLGQSLAEMYKSLGFTLLIDLLWFFGYVPIFTMALVSLKAIPQSPQPGDLLQSVLFFLISFCIWHSLVAGPLMTIVYTLYQERRIEYPSFKMFGQLFRRFYWRSVKINALFSLTLSLLFLNVILALNFPNILFLASGIVSLYCLLFVLMMSFYFNPLIYLENPLKKVIRKSFLLVIDNFLISFGFTAVLGIVAAVCITFPIAMFLMAIIYGPLLVYFTDRGFEAVYGRYDS